MRTPYDDHAHTCLRIGNASGIPQGCTENKGLTIREQCKFCCWRLEWPTHVESAKAKQCPRQPKSSRHLARLHDRTRRDDAGEPVHTALHSNTGARVSGRRRSGGTWLCDVFGFNVRIRIANHRVQLNVGDGAIVVKEQAGGGNASSPTATGSRRQVDVAYSVIVRVDDADRHHERAKQAGARILRPPADYPCGERQYSVEDFAGHQWTFSQSIADVEPEKWGGIRGSLS